MSCRVAVSAQAQEDLRRLHKFLLERELNRDGGDLDYPDVAVNAIESAFGVLQRHPYTCRKTDNNPFWRDLVISFGRTGYVALFEIASDDLIIVTAIRHQRDDDYH
ncbi:MAG: type II toxin-antitoxin system RelE/ParE family toxin [Paucibacter sp.]|nr:type II toxin-antitoxin system RelE/ParE family toxin [Roseateles sp.]